MYKYKDFPMGYKICVLDMRNKVQDKARIDYKLFELLKDTDIKFLISRERQCNNCLWNIRKVILVIAKARGTISLHSSNKITT